MPKRNCTPVSLLSRGRAETLHGLEMINLISGENDYTGIEDTIAQEGQMTLRYFLVIDIVLTIGFLALEALHSPVAACSVIALQFSTACTAFCLGSVVSSRKKFYYHTLAAALIIHGGLNILGIILRKSTFPGLQAPELYLAFTVPMLLFFVSICHYLLTTIDRYNRNQLLLDVYKIAVVIITATGAVTFDAYQKLDSFHWNFSPFYIALIIHIFIACLIFILSFISLFSKRKRQNAAAFLGLILFYLLITGYQTLVTFNIAGVFTCNLKIAEYMLAASCLILSFTLRYHYKIRCDEKLARLSPHHTNQPENAGKTYTTLFLATISVAIWAAGLLSSPVFFLVLFVLFILQRMDLLVQRVHSINSQLTKELTIDSLTGLHNRTYFIKELNARMDKKEPFALFFVNLIRFKVINNIYGPMAGDNVLKEIAGRLTLIGKQDDDISFFRCSGDEFAVLLKNNSPEQIEKFARLIATAIEQPLKIDQLDLSITAGIGVANYPQDTENNQELLKYADNAMRSAKQRKDVCYLGYSPAFAAELKRRNLLERKLQAPGFTNALSLFYQPKINLSDRKLYEMEALVRWFDQESGPISPAEFIPIAESMGKIDEISDWVFRTAFQQIRLWNETYNTNHIVNVNVSPITIHNKLFVEKLEKLLDTTGVKPEWIGIEITEHSAMTSPSYMREVLANISKLGIKISIDDFGTGYSSLSYLKRFDIDELKIAKEFIDNIEQGHDDYQIVMAIIMMAKGLSLETVAEGVEMQEQLTILENLGCDTIQGYFFEKPLPANELEERYLKKEISL